MKKANSPIQKLRLVVLISGRGTNLQAIIQACVQNTLQAEITAVISNRPDADGLKHADAASIKTTVLDHTQYPERAVFDAALAEKIDHYAPDLIILAGFMRILTPAFVAAYSGRILNIHPSLLPHFQGLHTHRRALAAKAKQHGASVHYVTAELDGGPVIMQAIVPILPNDNEAQLAARVLKEEHKIYLTVIRWISEGRLSLSEQQHILLDNQILTQPVIYTDT